MKQTITGVLMLTFSVLAGTSSAQNLKSAYLDGYNDNLGETDSSPVNQSADVSRLQPSGNTFSLEAWVFPMSFPAVAVSSDPADHTRNYIVSRSGSYNLQLFNDGEKNRFMFSFKNADGIWTGVAFPVSETGKWYHLAGVYTGSTAILYLDGVNVASVEFSGNLGTGGNEFFIGSNGKNEYFHGLIDDVRLWSTARTATQIADNRSSILTGNESGLNAWWPMETGSGGKTPDLSAGKNDLLVFQTTFETAPSQGTVAIKPFIDAFPDPAAYPNVAVVGQTFAKKINRPRGWPVPSLTLVQPYQNVEFNSESRTLTVTPVQGMEGRLNINFMASNPSGTDYEIRFIPVDKVPYSVFFNTNNHNAFGTTSFGNVIGHNWSGINRLYGSQPLFGQGPVPFRNFPVVTGTYGLSSQTEFGFVPFSEWGSFAEPRFVPSTIPGFDQTSEIQATENRSTIPVGVKLIQRVHTTPSVSNFSGVELIEQEYHNVSGTDLTSVFGGMVFDLDVSIDALDKTGYDSQRRLIYSYAINSSENSNFYGVVVLTEGASNLSLSKSISGNYPDSTLFRLISRDNLVTDGSAGDYRLVASAGPVDLKKGGTLRVVYAVIRGGSLPALQTLADQVRSAVNQNAVNPGLLSVSDVPFDQGGSVFVNWSASSLDRMGTEFEEYSVWRTIPAGGDQNTGAGFKENPDAGNNPDFIRFVTNSETGQLEAFEYLGSVPANHWSEYQFQARTPYDSTSKSPAVFGYLVSAKSGDRIYNSKVLQGYSVDNIPPSKPAKVIGKSSGGDLIITWNSVSDSDLLKYRIFRSMKKESSFSELEFLAETADTSFVVSQPQSGYYYSVLAEDFHENLSEPSQSEFLSPVSVTENDGKPMDFELMQNYPNPFNPSTTISFYLPVQSDIRLSVYDLTGRELSVLVSGRVQAGFNSVFFDASGYPSGVYHYRITSGNQVQNRKMILLK